MEIGRDDKLVFAVNFFDHFQQQLLHRSNKTKAQQFENLTITLKLSYQNGNSRDICRDPYCCTSELCCRQGMAVGPVLLLPEQPLQCGGDMVDYSCSEGGFCRIATSENCSSMAGRVSYRVGACRMMPAVPTAAQTLSQSSPAVVSSVQCGVHCPVRCPLSSVQCSAVRCR